MTPIKETDGKLEITLKNGQTKTIYATRIVSNEGISWKYVQTNGRTLIKESHLNPKQWAKKLGLEYLYRRETGEIHWQYNPNHTQNEKMVPEEIRESV